MATKLLDQHELEKIFKEQELHITAAVRVYLDVARQYAERIRELKDKPGFEQPVKDYTQQKQEAMWQAVQTAMVEQQQHWRFIEDADYFIDRLRQKYGDLDFVTDVDDLKRLAEVYHVANLQQDLKNHIALEHML